MKTYSTEADVKELLREKVSRDPEIVEDWLNCSMSVLGNRTPREYVNAGPELHASIGYKESDGWRDIAGLIFKCYG